MVEGNKLMAAGWMLSAVLLRLTLLLLLSNRLVPVMFLLLIGGAGLAILRDPQLPTALGTIRLDARWPSFALSDIRWNEVVVGVVFLALPQVPLTLGNAVIAITEENNRLFPNRPVTERGASISTGFDEPVRGERRAAFRCAMVRRHGRARTVRRAHGRRKHHLGGCLWVLAVFLSSSVQTIFALIPAEVLGVILFLTGGQLALGSCDFSKDKASTSRLP
jgi:hypothetical protein